MATRFNFKQSSEERKMRKFSKEFKLKKVKEIEQKKTRVVDVCKEYEVSDVSVYKWLKIYGSQKQTKARTIVESESDTRKLIELKVRLAELERIVGQKQVLIDFQLKVIELAEEEYGVDIKKKFGEKPLFTIGKKGRN